MVKAIVKVVERDPALLTAVEARVDPEALQTMRTSTRLAWVPAENFEALKRALHHQLGEAAYVELWRRYSSSITDNPLFRNLLEGGKRIFGNSPAGILKWMPKGWALTTRECGHLHTEVEPHAAVATIEGAPPCARHRCTGLSSAGSILGLFDLLSLEGECELDDSRCDEGRFVMRARWD